jgi:NitT/TauT family transport system permease protein
VTQGLIWPDLFATLAVWTIGFGAASVVGVAIGLLAGWSRWVRYIADPWLNVLHAIPDLALIPIFILWFGIGFQFKVFLVFLAGLFYVAVNTLAGVQATENRFIDVAKTFGAGRGRIFRTVLLPGSVPYIITGLRQGSARAIVGVVVAEFVSSNQGIGFRISLAASTLRIELVMFGIILLAGFGILVGALLGRLERRFDAWRVD